MYFNLSFIILSLKIPELTTLFVTNNYIYIRFVTYVINIQFLPEEVYILKNWPY